MTSPVKAIALFILGAAAGFLASRLAPNNLAPSDANVMEDRTDPSPAGHRLQAETSSSASTEADATRGDVSIRADSGFQARYHELLALPNGPEKVRQIKALFVDWGEAEGEAAYRFAMQLSGRERLACLASAAAGWARTEPRAAWDAIMAASNNGAMLSGQVSEVIDELARQDPVQATEFLSEVGSNWNRNRFFARILGTLATDAERSSLLTSLLASDADGSEQAVKALFENWGRYDFDAPLAAATRIENPRTSHAAMLGILEGWASVDGQGAFEYIVESGDSRLVKDALPSVAKKWAAASTADEMTDMLRTVSAIEGSDSVIKNLVADLARADPALAMGSVMALRDESARANHARDALSIWADANLAEAEAYFNALPSGRTKETAIWGLFNPAIHQGADPQRIMAHADALSDPAAIGRVLYSMSEYTRSADLGQKTDDLAAALEAHASGHPNLSDEMRQKILDNLAKRAK